MKTIHHFKMVLVVLGYIIITQSTTEAQNTFQKTYGTNGQGNQVILLKDSNYAVVGSMNGDVYVSKFDKFGNFIWHFTYGGTSNDYGYSIDQTIDGNYFYVVGTTMSFINGIAAAYLLKLDAHNGNLIWSKSFQGDGTSMNGSGGASVLSTKDGGCIFSGASSAFGTISGLVFIIKIDANGNLIWSNGYGGGNADSDAGSSIRATSDGGFIVTCNGNGDVILLKLDSIGSQQWSNSYGGSTLEYGFSVKETSDHGFIAVGYSESFATSGRSIYVIRTDSIGDTLWTKSISSPDSDKMLAGYSVDIMAGEFVIVGYNSYYAWGNSIYSNFLIKINENGNVIWSKNIQSPNDEWLYSVAASSDGGYLLTGQYNGTIYVAKADANGNVGCNESDAGMISVSPATIVTTMTLAQMAVIPVMNNCATIINSATPVNTLCENITSVEEVNMKQFSIYPNPASDYLIVVGVEKGTLKIFNSLGKLVLEKELNSKEEKINVNDLSNGMYLISIDNDLKKIIISK